MCDLIISHKQTKFDNENIELIKKMENISYNVIKGSLNIGLDKIYGGLYYMIDIENKPLLDATLQSDAKLWWPITGNRYLLINNCS